MDCNSQLRFTKIIRLQNYVQRERYPLALGINGVWGSRKTSCDGRSKKCQVVAFLVIDMNPSWY